MHPCALSVFLLSILTIGCSDRSLALHAEQPDSGPTRDAAWTDLQCAGDCDDFVISGLSLPPISSTGYGVGFVDDEGRTHNALAEVASAVEQLFSLNMNERLAQNLSTGTCINLLRLRLPPGTDLALARTWLGRPASCCPSAVGANCADEAARTCFGGSFAFEVEPSVFTAPVLQGRAGLDAASQLREIVLGPGRLRLRLPLTDELSMTLTLEQARVRANLIDGRLEHGAITGLVPPSVVDQEIVPPLALLLDFEQKNESLAPQTRDALRTLDEDGDGTISAEDLRQNDLMDLFIGGDIGIDGPGRAMSAGLIFTAVGGTVLSY